MCFAKIIIKISYSYNNYKVISSNISTNLSLTNSQTCWNKHTRTRT